MSSRRAASVLTGEFPIRSALPTINELQAHSTVPSLNKIRQAQTLLAEEGLLERRPGVGVYASSTTPWAAGRDDLLAQLHAARTVLNGAIALLERTDGP